MVGVLGRLGKAGRELSVVVGVFGGLGKAGRGSSVAVIEDMTVAFVFRGNGSQVAVDVS